MSARRQKRLNHSKSKLVVLKQEAADMYQPIVEQGADMTARRAKLLRDADNFANTDQTVNSINTRYTLRQS